MLFVVTGSAGSGKSAALRELAARRRDLVVVDTDDWGPPTDDVAAWWQERFEACVRDACSVEARGQDTVVAGWITREDVLATPGAGALEGVAVCLLDCDDATRIRRIEERAASGTWGEHRPERTASFLQAAAEMRADEDEATVRLDTTHLSVAEVASWLERWIAERGRRRAP
jgi:adenylate kinase family enzyme